MIKLKNKDSNYTAKIFRIDRIRKHSNADRLQIVTVDYQTVITGMDAQKGDLYVFIPAGSKLNRDYLHTQSEFRDTTLNSDPLKSGFFEHTCAVKALNLRGEKSYGYIIPAKSVADWVGVSVDILAENEGKYFDTINDRPFVSKYIPITTNTAGRGKARKSQKIARASRLIDGQVNFHVSTPNFRRNLHAINPNDIIDITYKLHGTSWVVANVLVKRKLTLMDKISKFFGANIQTTEYDIVYCSRRVVKNRFYQDIDMGKGFYNYDLWRDIADEIGPFVPKGYTFYGEYVGYMKNGKPVQTFGDKVFHYGNTKGEGSIHVYRITYTNPDGVVTDLSDFQIRELSNLYGFEVVPLIYHGRAKDLFDIPVDSGWSEEFLSRLEEEYTEKECYICKNGLPEEGIVIRKDSATNFEAYKLKSFKFLSAETSEHDNNIEDEN